MGRLGTADWRYLLRAQVALIRAERAVRSLRRGEMVHDDLALTVPAVLDRVKDAERVALAVSRAATYGLFRPKCLARAIALRQLLNEEGIEGAHVRIGVQLDRGAFIAHAWVEYAGQVVGDDPSVVSRYAPLPGVRVADLD